MTKYHLSRYSFTFSIELVGLGEKAIEWRSDIHLTDISLPFRRKQKESVYLIRNYVEGEVKMSF